ncbi:hypothetical protein [Pseudohongiella acticola]|jgi:hypothetical protein|uniref:hypothetical protein n=1 Tax=Pseudohongiella acticola TaxID=1524254 RepID=UPI0030EF89CD
MITKKAASIFLLLAFSISVACADTEAKRYHEFDAGNIDTLRINARVGTIQVEPSSSGKFEVELTITEEDGMSWIRRSPDIDDMDLRSRQRGESLDLSFSEKKVKTDWVIRVPEIDQLDVELGVGTVKVTLAQFGIVADLGVGTIELEAHKSEIGSVALSAGVGDTSISGGTDTESKRAIVSSESSAFGNGSQSIRARAGVGDVQASLI